MKIAVSWNVIPRSLLEFTVLGYLLTLIFRVKLLLSGNEERCQLDATILFITINNSTCFGHLYAHLQEYIDCILLHMVFSTRCCG